MPRFGAASSEVRIDVPRPVRVEAAPATCWRRKRDGGEARVMGIAGGGRHPVYNVQFAADVASRVTGGVDFACRGGDRPCSEPMADRIAPRRARLPSAFRLVCGSVSPRCARRSGDPTTPNGTPPPSSPPDRFGVDTGCSTPARPDAGVRSDPR